METSWAPCQKVARGGTEQSASRLASSAETAQAEGPAQRASAGVATREPIATEEAGVFGFEPFAQFRDRTDAGQRLAKRLGHYRDRPDVVVLGLARGGVPVAFEIARELHLPLDAFVVRKLGVPGHPEYAMGAIASGGFEIINDEVVHSLRIPASVINDVAAQEFRELGRRQKLYRGPRMPLQMAGKTVIVADDGIATGSSIQAAIAAVRSHKPARIVVAVPVAAREACEKFRAMVDELVCLIEPESFISVGQWYEDFRQIRDHDVHELLASAAAFTSPSERKEAAIRK